MSETIIAKRELSGAQKRVVKAFGDVVVTEHNGNHQARFKKDVRSPEWGGVGAPYAPLVSVNRGSKLSALNSLFHVVGVASDRKETIYVSDEPTVEERSCYPEVLIANGYRPQKVDYQHPRQK